MSDYNGWTNRATWLVQAWFDPQCESDVDFAKESIEDAAEGVPDFLRDFLTVNEINWKEIINHAEEQERINNDWDDQQDVTLDIKLEDE